jgi:hypothetical protein
MARDYRGSWVKRVEKNRPIIDIEAIGIEKQQK